MELPLDRHQMVRLHLPKYFDAVGMRLKVDGLVVPGTEDDLILVISTLLLRIGRFPRGPSRLSSPRCAISAMIAPCSRSESGVTKLHRHPGNAQIPPGSEGSRFMSDVLCVRLMVVFGPQLDSSRNSATEMAIGFVV
jgi:hypothetical protein